MPPVPQCATQQSQQQQPLQQLYQPQQPPQQQQQQQPPPQQQPPQQQPAQQQPAAEELPQLLPAATSPEKALATDTAASASAGRANNVSSILHQTRAGLQSALKEITACRTAKAQLQRDLTACEASEAKRGKDDGKAEHALHEEERCMAELQKTREAYRQRVAVEQELRLTLESEKGASQHATQQLAMLQAQYSPKAVEAACQARVAATERDWRKKLDEAVRTAHQLKAKLDAQTQLESQVGTLKRKLEQKQQLEAAIEGKHSKLTEVYKALESECQSELRACREASGQPPSSPDGATRERALALAADGDADALGGVGCDGAPSHTWYVGGLALLLGVLLGSALPASFRPLQRLVLGGAQLGRGARTRGGIEEMGGWMPSHTCVSLDGMKLS